MTRDEFLKMVFSKNKSASSVHTANYALKSLERFSLEKYSKDLELVLEDLKQQTGDERYYFLQDYIGFLEQKGKAPKTIRDYFSWAKLYLRRARGIKVANDDVKDLMVLPKVPTVQRKPLTLETIKILLDNASERQKGLFLTLVSSGMRLGEALSLQKKDFDFQSDPVRVTIPAQFTKDREQRGTYISKEAREVVLRLVKNKKLTDKVFTNQQNQKKAVDNEERIFARLRKRCGLDERYEETNFHTVNIHAFRAYFITKATQVTDHNYAHALAGHHAYLAQYYRLTPEERAKAYQKLEPSLTVYGSAELAEAQNLLLEERQRKDEEISRNRDKEREVAEMHTVISALMVRVQELGDKILEVQKTRRERRD